MSTILEMYDGAYDILIAGSLSRKEALPTSDIDGFVLAKSSYDKRTADDIFKKLEEIASSAEVNLKIATKGVFSTVTPVSELLKNYGGMKDTNQLLTRRMSVLIEGTGIGNTYTSVVYNTKKKILERYLRDIFVDPKKGPIFLINEIIRYYRTIAVDYEYKKVEVGKPWAVRLAKFRHSRKMLYIGALLPLVQSIKEKHRIEWLENQFINYTPLERIILLIERYGRKEDWDILKYYDNFIGYLKDNEFRDGLDNISFDQRDCYKNYQMISDNARNFRNSFHNFIKYVDHWQEILWKYVLS